MSQANFVNGSGGTIAPSVFVVFDTGSNKAVNQAADATHFIVGVSGEYSQLAPIPGASTVIATNPGDPVLVYQDTDGPVYLTATSAGWTAGDRLTATTGGAGIAASSANFYGAVALTTLSGAGLGQVKVLTGKNP